MYDAKKKGFQFFTGDINFLDYGGIWARQVAPRRFHFIELTNMDDACGSDNAGQPTYYVALSEVDLNEAPERETYNALRSCGAEDREELSEIAIAEMVRSYGVAAPLHSLSTNNAHQGIAECRKESYSLTRDAQAYQRAMERPVNLVGSTAREFGRGDLNSAIIRGAREGNPNAKLMAKMYVAAGGQTLGGQIPGDDLLAMKRAAEKGGRP